MARAQCDSRPRRPNLDSPTLFNSLPAELVSHIFLFVLGPTPERSFYRTEEEKLKSAGSKPSQRKKRRKTGSICLAAVCQRWRSIAFLVPPLWSHLILRFKKLLDDGQEVMLLQEWLNRSGTAPLHLQISNELYTIMPKFTEAQLERYKHLYQSLFRTLSSHITRCKVIVLDCAFYRHAYSPAVFETATASMFQQALPLLEEIEYDTCGSNIPAVFAFELLPNLRSLTSSNWSYIRGNISKNSLLEHIRTTGHIDDLYSILSSFPFLIHCDFHIDWNVFSETEPPYLDLPRLEVFYLGYHYLGDDMVHWDRLYMPSLKNLYIEAPPPSRRQEVIGLWPKFHPFLHISRPPLQSLTLNIPTIGSTAELTALLTLVPTLRSLRLQLSLLSNGVDASFWRALSGRLSDEDEKNNVGFMLCPALELLHVDAPSQHKLADVATMILSRVLGSADGYICQRASDHVAEGHSKLRNVKIKHCDFDEGQFLSYPGINHCIELNLSIKVWRWVPGRPNAPIYVSMSG